MGLDDRDCMRERRHREGRLGSATWIDAKARVEHRGLWFDAPSSGYDHRGGRERVKVSFAGRSAHKWILLLSALAMLVFWYGPAKRGGRIPDLEPGRPFPTSGSVTVARGLNPKRVMSSLEVQASGANAVVQLFEPGTRQHVISVYVAGGERVRVPVPLGTYQVRLVEGRKWHGTERWFGPNTAYETVQRLLTFKRMAAHIIDLRRRPNGNLHTSTELTRPERL